jgi:hypothetical protein
MIPRSDCAQVLRVKRFSAGHRDAVIRVYDEAGNVIETHEQGGEFKAWVISMQVIAMLDRSGD